MKKLHEAALMGGFFWGAILGAGIALFNAPRLRPAQQFQQVQQEVREKLVAAVPADPIDQSIAEGKAAARRRLTEAGQTAVGQNASGVQLLP